MKAYEFESVRKTRRQVHEQFQFFREMLSRGKEATKNTDVRGTHTKTEHRGSGD